MPTIANRAQQVYTGGIYPVSAYTRVIGLTCLIPDDGSFAYNYSQPVGNKVWLLHVKVMCIPKPDNYNQATSFVVYAGQGAVNHQSDLTSWERIIPLQDPLQAITTWTMYDGRDLIEWDMSKLYKGKNRRFAIGGRRYGGFRQDALQVSFTIAEG